MNSIRSIFTVVGYFVATIAGGICGVLLALTATAIVFALAIGVAICERFERRPLANR